jgi:tetratricopeptide (TPR) repeat protein
MPHATQILFEQALAHQQQQAWQAAEQSYRALLNADPLHVDAWNNLALVAAQQGDWAQAEKRLRRALSIDPANAGARQNLVKILRHQAQSDEDAADWAGARDRLRELMQLQPGSSLTRHRLLEVLQQGGLSVEPADVGLVGVPRAAMIAALPWSGGEYVQRALCQRLGWHTLDARREVAGLRNDLDLAVLTRSPESPWAIAVQAVPPTLLNLGVLQAAHMPTVIIVRDLADMVYNAALHADSLALGVPCTADAWRAQPKSWRMEVALDGLLPVWVEFVLGWQRVVARHPQAVLWLDYAALKHNTAETLLQIAQFYGGDASYYQWAATVALLEEPEANRWCCTDPTPGCGKALPSEIKKRISSALTRYGVADRGSA